MNRRAVLALISLASAFPQASSAQTNYPVKPIKLIVQAGPGTAHDLVARPLAQGLSEEFKTPVVVENRVGASGIIGTDFVAKSAPDGYTLMFTGPVHYIGQFAFKSLPFDPVKDFRPVTKISNSHLVLVVSKDSPFSNVRQIIDHAKQKPNALRYGSTGQGTATQLAFALLNSMAGIQIQHVPYKAGGQLLTDVMGSHIDMAFFGVATALSQAKAGAVKLLGVSGLNRSRSLPDVPTIAEAALEGFEIESWGGVLAPRATPDFIVQKLNAAMVKVGQSPQFQANLIEKGIDPDVLSTALFDKQLAAESSKWRRLIELSGPAQK